MMIDWSNHQRSHVVRALARHPLESSRCAQAAGEILPTAQEVDPSAHALVIEANEALYVQPKNKAVRWFHHVTVSAAEHCVDVLTGPDGHDRLSYLTHFFDHPEHHVTRPVEPGELEEL